MAANLGRIEELKAEAAALEAGARLDMLAGRPLGLELRPPGVRPGAGAPPEPREPARGAAAAAGAAAPRMHAPGRRPSSGAWLPATFSSALGPQSVLEMESAGQPWVLFRDIQGGAACIKDECAHRACPLSLVRPRACACACASSVQAGGSEACAWLQGKAVGGHVQCPYHGAPAAPGARCRMRWLARFLTGPLRVQAGSTTLEAHAWPCPPRRSCRASAWMRCASPRRTASSGCRRLARAHRRPSRRSSPRPTAWSWRSAGEPQ